MGLGFSKELSTRCRSFHLIPSMLATLFIVPCICHYFHVPVAIVKCVKICGFVTIYRGSPAKTLSHTPKMLYGKVLNNIAWDSLSKICKTLHWKTPYLSTSGAALRQLRGSLIKAIESLHVLLWYACATERVEPGERLRVYVGSQG